MNFLFFLNVNFWAELGMKNPLEIMWILFISGGWIPIVIIALFTAWNIRIGLLQNKFSRNIEHVLLAIDIPKDSEQTPKAMEQVFATISGAHQDISKRAAYFKGEIQLSFSFEIISIDGFVQFLIRTPKIHRDLIEGAVYSQYPDAEISEVEDYTKDVPTIYPDERFNFWGSELKLHKHEAYPLRTYQSFEDPLSQELKDPLSSLIETMSRIQKNEQVWFQIILKPTENEVWVARVLKQAYKIAGKKVEEGRPPWYGFLLNFIYQLPDWIPWLQTEAPESVKNDRAEFRVMNLTPGEKFSLESIERKASKLGFICKLRLIYLSPHEQYQTGRVVNSVFGAIKQFGDLTGNALKPNKRTKTSVVWFFVDRRKNSRRRRLMRNYKSRSWYMGSKYFILNVEELATLYHFPAIQVKSPNLKRTEVKKSDSPPHLPTFDDEPTPASDIDLRSQLVGLQLNNDYYEKKYAHGSDTKKIIVKKNIATDNSNQQVPDNLPVA